MLEDENVEQLVTPAVEVLTELFIHKNDIID